MLNEEVDMIVTSIDRLNRAKAIFNQAVKHLEGSVRLGIYEYPGGPRDGQRSSKASYSGSNPLRGARIKGIV